MGDRTREYELKLTASFTKSPAVVLNDLPAASEKAKAKVERDAKKMGDALGKGFDAAIGKAKKAYADIEALSAKAAAKQIADDAKKAQASVKAEQAAFDQKLKLVEREVAAEQRAFDAKVRAQARFLATQRKAKEREADNEIKDAERAAVAEERIQARAVARRTNSGGRLGANIASGAFNNVGRLASGAMGLGREIASGLGVDFSLAGQLSKGVSFQKNITDVTNAGLGIQGKLAGKDDYAATTKAVQGSADYAKMDQGEIASGLAIFVDKASDIEAGKAMLNSLSDLAHASGTDFKELASSAGEIWKAMGPAPDKLGTMNRLLAIGAKEGQIGNLAFKELAPTIGKLASQASKYQGTFDSNFVDMMASAQIASRGGANGGSEMVRASQAFTQDLSKKGTRKEFAKAGIKLFSDQNAQGGGTMLRSQEDIILDTLKYAKGDITKFSAMFKGIKAGAVITGAANIAREAGGGQAGIDAVQKTWTSYRGAMSQDEITNSANARKGNTDSKAADFNNQLERIASSLAERVLPQMEQLGPKIINFIDALSKMIGWASENPGSAITAAIIASIGKAAIGSMLSAALPELIKGAMGAKLAGAGSLGALGTGLGIAMATFMIGSAVINLLSDATSKGQNAAVNDNAATADALTNAKANLEGKGRGGTDADNLKTLEERKAALAARIDGAKSESYDGLDSLVETIYSSKTLEQRGKRREDMDHLNDSRDGSGAPGLLTQQANVEAAIKALHTKMSGVINVNIVSGGAAVGVGAGGREGTH